MILECLIPLLLLLAGAPQESGTIDLLHIDLKNIACDRQLKVYAVLEGDDDTHSYATSKDGCHWTASLRPARFNTAVNHFSIRVEGRSRSKCGKAEWNPNTKEAEIVFRVGGPVLQLTAELTPRTEMSYLRELPSRQDPCTEKGTLPNGPSPWRIMDTDLDVETVRLHYPEAPHICGLVVNAIPGIKTKFKGQPVPLDKPLLVDTLAAQGNGLGRCSAPNLSTAAVGIFEKQIPKKPVPKLSIQAE